MDLCISDVSKANAAGKKLCTPFYHQNRVFGAFMTFCNIGIAEWGEKSMTDLVIWGVQVRSLLSELPDVYT